MMFSFTMIVSEDDDWMPSTMVTCALCRATGTVPVVAVQFFDAMCGGAQSARLATMVIAFPVLTVVVALMSNTMLVGVANAAAVLGVALFHVICVSVVHPYWLDKSTVSVSDTILNMMSIPVALGLEFHDPPVHAKVTRLPAPNEVVPRGMILRYACSAGVDVVGSAGVDVEICVWMPKESTGGNPLVLQSQIPLAPAGTDTFQRS